MVVVSDGVMVVFLTRTFHNKCYSLNLFGKNEALMHINIHTYIYLQIFDGAGVRETGGAFREKGNRFNLFMLQYKASHM